jgi:hypothetical protein
MSPRHVFVTLLLSLGAGCTGQIAEGPVAPEAPGPSAPVAPAPGAKTGSVPTSGATPGAAPVTGPYAVAVAELRRLTRREYDNTVRDLLGDASSPARAFVDDAPGASGYEAPGAMGSLEVDAHMQAAEKLAANAVGRLAQLSPCGPKTAAEEEPCAVSFIKSFAPRAFRRPLLPEEAADLLTLYREVRASAGLSFADAIGAVIQGVLQSPNFIYHRERGADRPVVEGSAVRYTSYELASRLSYFVGGTMPDGPLLDAAAAGKLADPAELEAQGRRLAAKLPVLSASIADFARQWLDVDSADLEKSKDVYPEWATVKPLLPAELGRFVSNVVEQGLPPQALFSDQSVFVNRTSAKVYGLPAPTTDELMKLPAPGGQRAGLFTQLGFLAVHATATGSHPVKRGVIMVQRVLCGTMPPPPPDVPAPAPPQPGLTTRERFSQHSQNACASCHKVIDPLGFAFEGYDGIGRFRTTEAGKPVDATGSFTLPSGGEMAFQNAADLLPRLADTVDVRTCLARQLARYGTQTPEGPDLDVARELLAAPGSATNLTELYIAVLKSRAFRYRKPATGEVL